MIVAVKVKPGTRSDNLTMDAEGVLHAKIRARPVKGAANEYLIEILSKALKIRKSNITIVKGLATSHKRVRITGDETTIAMRLESLRQQD